MQGLIDTLRKAGVGERAAGRRDQFARILDGAPPLDDPLGQLGYAVHPFLGRHNQTGSSGSKKLAAWAVPTR